MLSPEHAPARPSTPQHAPARCSSEEEITNSPNFSKRDRIQQEQQDTEKTQEGFTPPESVPIVSVNDEEDDFDEEEN